MVDTAWPAGGCGAVNGAVVLVTGVLESCCGGIGPFSQAHPIIDVRSTAIGTQFAFLIFHLLAGSFIFAFVLAKPGQLSMQCRVRLATSINTETLLATQAQELVPEPH